MRHKLILVLVPLFLLSTIGYGLLTAYAEVPHLINYQGRLTDKQGKPVADGVHSITFRIFDAESAGTLLWEEAHSSLQTQKGLFSVLLGSVANLNLPFDRPYYLEIKVGNEVMSPRQQITSAAYAIRAEKAEMASQAGQAQNADTVANVGVSATPQANKLLPLDANAKLPYGVLKIYDSGWFAVSYNSSYLRTHNLGTTKIIAILYYATDSNGSNMVAVASSFSSYDNLVQKGGQIQQITPTTFIIRTAENGGVAHIIGTDLPSGDNRRTSGYYRVIAMALE